MDNSNKLNEINNYTDLNELYNSLHENSIIASHKHDWIADGGEIEITAAAYTIDKDPYIWMLTNENLSVRQKDEIVNKLAENLEQDVNGAASYKVLKDEEAFDKLKKDYPDLFEQAKTKALKYIDTRLQANKFPRTYDEYASPENPVFRQLGHMPSYKKLVENMDKYYNAIADRQGKSKKEFKEATSDIIKEVKELIEFKNKLTKDTEAEAPAAPAPVAQQAQQNTESTTGHKPFTRQVPTAIPAIPGNAGLTETKQTKTKSKNNNKFTTKTTQPQTFDELYDKVQTSEKNKQTDAAKPQTLQQENKVNQPATIVDPEDGTVINYGAGKYFLLYQVNPDAFKNLSKEQKEEAAEEIANNLESISIEQLFTFLKDNKKQFKEGSPLYNTIVDHIVQNDKLSGGMNSARLLDRGFAIENEETKALAVKQAEEWLERNPKEQTRFGKLMKYLKDVFTKEEKKDTKEELEKEFETKDSEFAESKEQDLPKNLKEFEEQPVEDKANNTHKDDLGIQYFPGNNYAPEIKATDDEKLIEMYKVLDAVGADEKAKSFLAYKQKKDNGYFQVFYKEFKEHPKTAITDLLDVMNNTEWSPEEPAVEKQEPVQEPEETKVNNEELLKIFKQDYKAQFSRYPDELILKVLEMPEVTEEEKTKFLTAYNKNDADIKPEDMKIIYEFVSDISNFLSKQLPAYKEKVEKGRANDARWMEYHEKNQQRLQQNDIKSKLEQELRDSVESAAINDSEKMAVYTVLHNSTLQQLQQFKDLLESDNPDDVIKNVLLKIHNKKQLAQAQQANQIQQSQESQDINVEKTNTTATKATLLFVKANFVKK